MSVSCSRVFLDSATAQLAPADVGPRLDAWHSKPALQGQAFEAKRFSSVRFPTKDYIFEIFHAAPAFPRYRGENVRSGRAAESPRPLAPQSMTPNGGYRFSERSCLKEEHDSETGFSGSCSNKEHDPEKWGPVFGKIMPKQTA